MADRNTNPNDSVGARPVGAPARKIPVWLLPLLGLLVLAIILLLLLSRCGGDDDSSSTASPTTTTTASTTDTATTDSATTDPAPTTTPADTGAGGAQSGTVTADDSPLLPLAAATKIGAGGDLSAYTGTKAAATAIAVQSVPADEGFWVGSGPKDRVWVELTGKAGESPYKVKKGDLVAFTGSVVKNVTGFAKAAGVTDAEGKKMLNSQGQHIAVAKSVLKLSK